MTHVEAEPSLQNDYQLRVNIDLQSINGPLCFENVAGMFKKGPEIWSLAQTTYKSLFTANLYNILES